MLAANHPPRPAGLGARHLQILMTFLCLTLTSFDPLGIAIAVLRDDGDGSDPTNPFYSYRQGVTGSSALWGYLILQLPAGHLARKVGPKFLLFGAALVNAFCSICEPFIAQIHGWTVFCLVRFVQGLAQGVLIPCITEHTVKWVPFPERHRLFSFVFVGTVVGPMLSSMVATSPWGWPSIFYSTGLCGVLWSAVWLFVGADSPDSHPSISDSEREYIKFNLRNTFGYSKIILTPWKKILSSKQVWALVLMHFCHNWGYWTLNAMLPVYFRQVFTYDMTNHALISTLPYLIKLLLTIAISWMADFTIEHGLISVSATRKFWNSIAYWGGAAGLVLLSLFTSLQGSLVLQTAAGALGAGMFSGFLSNHLDLAPNFAGLLMGLTTGLGTFASILAPAATGFIVTDESNRSEWATLFQLSAIVFTFGNLAFFKYGSTEVQAWNQPMKYGVDNDALEFEDIAVFCRRRI